jgi:hypothetical protein
MSIAIIDIAAIRVKGLEFCRIPGSALPENSGFLTILNAHDLYNYQERQKKPTH